MAHILLVDDDTDLVTANRLYLESRGHRVRTAHSGDEGWKALGEELPDLLVLDCMMEEFTTGFELAHDISIRYPSLPLIMLTSVHDYMSSAWNYGPEDKRWLPLHKFLEKPVPPEKLEEEIGGLLQGRA